MIEPETARRRLNRVFQDIFDDQSLKIADSMTAADVEGWDSLTHIDLIVQVEREFAIKLSTAEVRALKNVGDFVALIAQKAR
jgi:acyl carrier protein